MSASLTTMTQPTHLDSEVIRIPVARGRELIPLHPPAMTRDVHGIPAYGDQHSEQVAGCHPDDDDPEQR